MKKSSLTDEQITFALRLAVAWTHRAREQPIRGAMRMRKSCKGGYGSNSLSKLPPRAPIAQPPP